MLVEEHVHGDIRDSHLSRSYAVLVEVLNIVNTSKHGYSSAASILKDRCRWTPIVVEVFWVLSEEHDSLKWKGNSYPRGPTTLGEYLDPWSRLMPALC